MIESHPRVRVSPSCQSVTVVSECHPHNRTSSSCDSCDTSTSVNKGVGLRGAVWGSWPSVSGSLEIKLNFLGSKWIFIFPGKSLCGPPDSIDITHLVSLTLPELLVFEGPTQDDLGRVAQRSSSCVSYGQSCPHPFYRLFFSVGLSSVGKLLSGLTTKPGGKGHRSPTDNILPTLRTVVIGRSSWSKFRIRDVYLKFKSRRVSPRVVEVWWVRDTVGMTSKVTFNSCTRKTIICSHKDRIDYA